MSQKEGGNKRFNDLYTKQQVWNLLISYNVNIRSLVKIGAVWAFHFECEVIRIAFFYLIKSIVSDILEPAAHIILQYSMYGCTRVW